MLKEKEISKNISLISTIIKLLAYVCVCVFVPNRLENHQMKLYIL